MKKLLTWLDIERVVREKTSNCSDLPSGIARVDFFSDVVEIGLEPSVGDSIAGEALKGWFGDWFQEELFQINLDVGDNTIGVELTHGEKAENGSRSPKPLWQDVAYLRDIELESKRPNQKIAPPDLFQTSPSIVAFHSFKGGVGRTTMLVAHLFALLNLRPPDKPLKCLVVDADLEAPGLTYWLNETGNCPNVSFIDYLESVHYPAGGEDGAARFFANEIKKASIRYGGSEIYTLPAFVDEHQLLDTPILPEHIAKGPNGPWACGNAIHDLGRALDADYVFVDLRAGLSEISGPLLFDPRIERFLITTIAEQSVSGTALVLKRISNLMAHFPKKVQMETASPGIIISMLTPELKDSVAFERGLIKLQSAFSLSDDIQDDLGSLQVKETFFEQPLLSVSDWNDAQNKLSNSVMIQSARRWAEEKAVSKESEKKAPENTERVLAGLLDICEKYEFAESGEGKDFLVTEPIRNMAKKFRDSLPCLVSLGAKGSGKTFCHLQICRFQKWASFLEKVLGSDGLEPPDAFIYPLAQSANLKDAAKEILFHAREKLDNAFGKTGVFSAPDFLDSIDASLKHAEWGKKEWIDFWVSKIANAIGMFAEQNSLSEVNDYLAEKGKRVIFLFDGLEDIFQDVENDHAQQTALKALIELPNRISEIRDSSIGVIIFLRRDYPRHAISLNLGQFEALYKSYMLSWDAESFLQLVYWICGRAGTPGFVAGKIASMRTHEILGSLEKIWGMKLGKDNSREAYTARWIFAALTDFNGKLQARDIVRILLNAAKLALNDPKSVKFDFWKDSRLLPPAAIRRSLTPCSKAKIKEAREESPAFREWVDNMGRAFSAEKRVIPFTPEQFDMKPRTIEMLREMGVLFDERDPDGVTRFYMPEIYRTGLDFNLEKGARPKVLVLKRKAMGKELF